ncbi:MAG: DUF4037 domain-containing protein [Cyanobacteria bacterium REEB67]|nr:DUF4037 domain-containing protein [Cyanobacteria bacterium REEB67]
MLAAGWTRIEQEQHLMGRAGFVGDEIGSAVIGARLVRDIMRLCFLMEKRYAPYPKWFGTAFQKLHCAPLISKNLESSLAAISWEVRQQCLKPAYETIARMHNKLHITDPLNETTRSFHERQFIVMSMGAFSEAILQKIEDPQAEPLPQSRESALSTNLATALIYSAIGPGDR